MTPDDVLLPNHLLTQLTQLFKMTTLNLPLYFVNFSSLLSIAVIFRLF